MTQKWKFALLTLVLGAATWIMPARADDWDKMTVLTFNESVGIPGGILPAGTYVFKLLDSPSDRKTVQIFTEDETQLIATILAIPDYRQDTPEKTVMTFKERAAGSPRALHTWFYPGDNSGLEFVYPKTEPRIVAKAAEPTPAPQPPAPEKALEPPAIEQQLPELLNEQTVVALQEPVLFAEATVAAADNAAPLEIPVELPKP